MQKFFTKTLLILLFLISSILTSAQAPASALNFDGANDFVEIPRLNFSASNVMTIEAWIRPNNITTNTFYEISRQQIQALNPPDWLLSFQNNGTILSFGTRTTAGYDELDVIINPANYVDGNWHHIAAVYDGATKRIYRDGALIGSNNFSGTLIFSPTSRNIIGNSPEIFNEWFNGNIDEVRFWNRALPQCEILNNMNCELAAGQTNLMAYYQFNQGIANQANPTVTSLADASGNGRTGTLTNFGLTGATSNWVNPGGVVTGTTCTAFVPLSATSSQLNVTCFAGNNGSATVVPIGGFGGYTYSWSPSGGTAATATGLTAGSFTCTITSGGCVITRNFTITQPASTPTPTGITTQVYAGTTANLTALSATGTAIQWYAAASGGGALPNTTTLVNGTTYHANQTISGCASITRLAVTANQISAASQNLCTGNTVANLVSTPSVGATANWFTVPTGGTALSNTTALTTGTYYVEQIVPLSVSNIASGFNSPTGVAIQSDGKIVVADRASNTVKRINADGTGFITLASGFNNPYGVAVQSDGKILVADFSNSSIKRMNADGSGVVTLGSGFSAPTGVTEQSDGKIIVADYGNSAIKRMNADGSGIVILGSGFANPWGVAVESNGKILVADNGNSAIKRMNADGSGIVTLASSVNCFGVAVQGDGKIVFIDYSNGAIKRMNADGSGISTLATSVNPFGVAVQSDGKIIFSNNSTNIIKRITEAQTSNRVAVSFTLNPATISNHLDNVTQNIVGTGSSIPIVNSSCRIITSILPNGATPITGNTTARVWIESTQPAQFVKRHYEITPATGASTAIGNVTLYFTQAEFDDFNAANVTDLPTNSGDAAGKANLLIEKRGGVSNNGSGLPNTYTGTITTINPADADIVWNNTLSRWEISFDVTGFSGFFVKTIGFVLPIKLISFTAQSLNNSALVKWGIAQPESGAKYSLERSTNGVNFTAINNQTGNTTNKQFNYTDNNLADGKYYYRLKIIDVDGKISYTNIVAISIGLKDIAVSIYPNPVSKGNSIQVNLTNTKLLGWRLVNTLGQIIAQEQNINANIRYSIKLLSTIPIGVYQLQLITSNGVKSDKVIIH